MKCCKSQNLNSLLANILEFANINHKNWKNQKLNFFLSFEVKKLACLLLGVMACQVEKLAHPC